MTKCEKTARERRTLLISDSNGSVPTSPTELEPKSRTTSESQQVGVLETSSSVSLFLFFFFFLSHRAAPCRHSVYKQTHTFALLTALSEEKQETVFRLQPMTFFYYHYLLTSYFILFRPGLFGLKKF